MELKKVTEVTKVIAEKHFIFCDSVLNVTVSAWPSYFDSTNTKPVNLLTWLQSGKYAKQIEAIRKAPTKAERDKLKAKLPAITPSGLFSKREESGLIEHSGFIQFDIDFKENTHIGNYPELKKQLSNIQNIAFIGYSASGTGYWGLIPIKYPHKHREHFLALQSDFSKLGIVLDEKPQNVASLRGYSWDVQPYFNHNAQTYSKTLERKPAANVHTYRSSSINPKPQSSEADKVEAILVQIEHGGIDITSGYGHWFSIGCALSNEFGEAGRDYFHRVSQYFSGYSTEETNRTFTQCLKHKYRYTLGTFFEIAQQYGLQWKHALAAPKQVQPPLKRLTKEEPLPTGFRWVYGNTLEVDGLPLQMLSDKELEEVKQRLKKIGSLLPAIPEEAFILLR